MQPMAALRKRFETDVWPRPFEPLPRIGSDGLMLGHGTVLARWAQDRPGHAFAEADDERVVALLSAIHGRPVSPQVMKHVARAAMRWSAGEKALAHIELAFARLPRLDTSEDGYRLFLASCLLDEGTTPRQLAEALGFDPDVLKYDPDQPRVPAGNGRESGRWEGDIHNSSRVSTPVLIPNTAAASENDSLKLIPVATTTNFKYACKKLGIDPIDASDALHAAKEAARLRGADSCVFDLETGDIFHNGEHIGNLGE